MQQEASQLKGSVSQIASQRRRQSPSPSSPSTTRRLRSSSSISSQRPPSPSPSARDQPGPSSKLQTSHRRSTPEQGSFGQPSAPSQSESMAAYPGFLDPAGEITYTPTTHRISKAKKGKKVHICEFGCGKVFTRAEHRKRHEANHLSIPLFRCPLEECRKPFQRADLLNRHMSRQHGFKSPTGPSESGVSQRRDSSVSSSAALSSHTSSPVPNSVVPRARSSMSTSSAPATESMSIRSIIEPIPRQSFPQQNHSWNDAYQQMPTSMSKAPSNYPSDLAFGLLTTSVSPMNSSESCYSPVSDIVQSHIVTQRYLPYGTSRATSTPLSSGYNTPAMSASMPATLGYTGYEDYSQPIEGLGIDLESQFPVVVGSTTPGAFANVVRHTGHALRSERPITPAVVGSQDGLVSLDNRSVQNYHESYWENFHPYFPIVHRSTFDPNNPGGLLNATVLAIGAQFSRHPLAASHSLAWFELASRPDIRPDTTLITSQAPLANLQAVFLLEIFNLYRSRFPGVHRSLEFSSLYSSLLHDREQAGTDPAVSLADLPQQPTQEQLQAAHARWLDLETRRRLLLASFILDTHRSALFQQSPAHTFSTPDLPTPSTDAAWDSTTLQGWLTNLTLISTSHPASPFQNALIQCLILHSPTNPPPSSLLSPPDATTHAILLATHTPLSALLLTASESWLFARKDPNLGAWSAAKTALRAWVESEDATIAVWHAGFVLRSRFSQNSLSGTGPSDTTPGRREIGLQAGWCLYIAALVCWAYGYQSRATRGVYAPTSNPPTQPGAPSLPSPIENLLNSSTTSALPYLSHLAALSQKNISSLRGEGGTLGLLRLVRGVLKMEGGGALLVEGGRVLERIGEGAVGF